MNLIPALLKNEALLADVASVGSDKEFCHFWWLGQSGFLVKWAGRYLLFDPYLSDSLTHKYATTDKPHVRLSERVIDPAALSMVNVVTSSHNHTDHLDAHTLLPMAKANSALRMVLPAANIGFARARLGDGFGELLGINDDRRELEVSGFNLSGVAAAHNEIVRDASGQSQYLGFIVRCGGFTIYHSGDTLWHDGLVPTIQTARPDVMLLPINGNKPERRVAGNLNGTEAAALAKACGARLVVPHHYDMFAFNTATTEEFTTACERLAQDYRVLRGGERLTITIQTRP